MGKTRSSDPKNRGQLKCYFTVVQYQSESRQIVKTNHRRHKKSVIHKLAIIVTTVVFKKTAGAPISRNMNVFTPPLKRRATKGGHHFPQLNDGPTDQSAVIRFETQCPISYSAQDTCSVRC